MILGPQPVQRFKLACSLHIQVKNENQIQQFFAYQQKEEFYIQKLFKKRSNENKKRKRKGIILTCHK